MSDEELPIFEAEELEETTLEAVRESLPRVFDDKPFIFELETIESVNVKKNMQTKHGVVDMYILKSNPKVYCFRNAYNLLAEFVEEQKIKLPSNISYIGREGSAMETKYIFEKVK